jgi:hypothetical protein
MVGDELQLPPARDEVAVESRRGLHADSRGREGQAPLERRRRATAPRTTATPTTATPITETIMGSSLMLLRRCGRVAHDRFASGRVDEDRGGIGDGDVGHVGHDDPRVDVVHRRVVPGADRVGLVPIDAHHRARNRAEDDQVTADAAAQVEDDAVESREAGSAMPGDVLGRRLLESGAGEQHPTRAGELGLGASTQLGLLRRGGDQIGRPPFAQLLRDPQVTGDSGVEQAGCGEQRAGLRRRQRRRPASG